MKIKYKRIIKSLFFAFIFIFFSNFFTSCSNQVKDNEFITITFDGNGGSLIEGYEIQTVENINQVEEPLYEKKGYEFIDWNVNFEKINYSTTVFAEWIPITYKINYLLSEDEVNDYRNANFYNIESNSINLYPAVKKGYDFMGWKNKDGETIDFIDANICTDVTLEPIFEPKTYNITYHLNGGTIKDNLVKQYSAGQELEIPSPDLEGYKFVGWSKYGSLINPVKDYKITNKDFGDLNLYACFTSQDYKVSLDVNGGNKLDNSLIDAYYQLPIHLPVPSRIGYDFSGWYIGEKKYNDGAIWDIHDNTTLYAKWTLHNYEINIYKDNNEIKETLNYTIEDEDINVDNPQKDGYTFSGWKVNESDKLVKDYIIKKGSFEDISLYPNWTPNKYIITYNANGGFIETKTQEVIYDSTYELAIPKRNNYDFVGWQYNGNVINNGMWNITQDIVIFAQWTPTQYEINYILNSGNNNENNLSNYDIETHDLNVLAPTRKGYTFKGWFINGSDELVKEYTIKEGSYGDITLEAKWDNNKYVITYDANGGNIESELQNVIYDKEFSLKKPIKKYYTFEGWYYGDEKIIDGVWKIDSDITLIAQWIPNKYSITSKYNDEIIGTNIVEYGVKFSLNPLQKSNFNFDGYYTKPNGKGTKIVNNLGESLDIYKFDKDIVIYANFKYEIDFVTNNGSMINSLILNETDDFINNIDISKESRTFEGWYYDEKLVEPFISNNILGNTTLYAKWIEETEPFNFEYEQLENGIRIISLNNYSNNELIIPDYIGDKKVIEIASNSIKNNKLTNIVVPNTIETICESAFSGCNSLKSITLPFVGKSEDASSVSSVFGYIFGYASKDSYNDPHSYYCYSGDTDFEIGAAPYKPNCVEEFENIYVTTKNEKGGIWQYSNYTKYYRGYSSDGVYYLRSYYYFIPESLTEVNITVDTTIPDAAFNGCTMLENINLVNCTESIGKYAFQNCPAKVDYTINPTKSGAWDGTMVADKYHGGTGTQSDPYQIFCAKEFIYFLNQIRNGETYENTYFVLTSNINLGNHEFNSTALTDITSFKGTLNGNGHKIFDGKLVMQDNIYNGLFGFVDGTIKNIGFDNLTSNITTTSSEDVYIGLIIGKLNGTLENIYVNGKLITNSSHTVYSGGIVGFNSGNIINSYSNVDLNSSCTNLKVYAGGLVGFNDGNISGSFAYGNVTAHAYAEAFTYASGLVGEVGTKSNVTDCFRYDGQVITKFGTVSTSLNEIGTLASIEDIINYCKLNWDGNIWQFDKILPSLK